MSVSASEAVRGNSGILATFKIGVAAAVEFFQDIKSFELQGAEADDSDLTFAEVAAGTAQADTLAITAIQSTHSDSFWRFCWDNAGKAFACDYAPHGNAVATEDKPHFRIEGTMGLRPNIGGDARRSKERNTFDTTFEVDSVELITDPIEDTITDGV